MEGPPGLPEVWVPRRRGQSEMTSRYLDGDAGVTNTALSSSGNEWTRVVPMSLAMSQTELMSGHNGIAGPERFRHRMPKLRGRNNAEPYVKNRACCDGGGCQGSMPLWLRDLLLRTSSSSHNLYYVKYVFRHRPVQPARPSFGAVFE